MDQVRALENLYSTLSPFKKYTELIPLLSSLLKHIKKEDTNEHYRVLNYIYALSLAYLATGDELNGFKIYKTHTPFMEVLKEKELETMTKKFEGLASKFNEKRSSEVRAERLVEDKMIMNEPKLPENSVETF